MGDPSTYPNINPSHDNGQGLKDALTSGEVWPVAESVKGAAAKTTSEFQDLANSRHAPVKTAANGQPLTNYHSMFYNLLSWEHPRATAISFAITLTFIILARYLSILRYLFKFAYFVLGATASAEVVGKLLFNNGFASRFRPRKYYVIPRESLERVLGDVENLINFFVIEFQRIVFAENVPVTFAAFASAVISYWLIKIVPFWGLCFIGTCVIYLAPLIYITNREFIDGQLQHVGDVVNSQATQIKDLTSQHATKATESMKSYAGEYTAKAQEYISSARGATPASKLPPTPVPAPTKVEDLNAAPNVTSVSDPPAIPKIEQQTIPEVKAEAVNPAEGVAVPN